VNNIYANALKFTPDGGSISTVIKQPVKEYVTFYISIPADLKEKENEETVEQEEPDRKTLLIVEDNVEFRRFLVEQLSNRFNMLQAGDGEQGLETAAQKYPDLIISDLMMPVMNGLELCEKIKNNLQTSHIPVILLTARLSDEAKIECYRAGADSYIAKPFNFEVLLTRIEMLIEQQEKRKRLFREELDVQPDSITTTSLDKEFIGKTLQLIEKNIGNPDYSNDDLGRDLGMSRSCLYPKFQSIAGQTPNHFIRSIRLKRAAQLLQAGQYTVSEISWMVGINDIKYFNKYFKEEFGVTPTQYKKENTNTDENP
jgi:CheY-like chemotaxis protein/methylphosphotriester-DNA--protein-cysteine methyltransferase